MSIISQHFSVIYCLSIFQKMHKKEKPFGFSFFAVIYFGNKQPD